MQSTQMDSNSVLDQGDMGGNGSGRKPIELDMEQVLDLITEMQMPIPDIAGELGISPQTLRKKIQRIQNEQGLLLDYRALQSLELTALQARILEAITPQKIEAASLHELVAAYKILKDKELAIEGKPSEIKGLVAHLLYLEKQEATLKNAAAGIPPTAEEFDEAEIVARDKGPGSIALFDDQEF